MFSSKRWVSWVFLCAGLGLCAYSAWFIYRSSFVIDGVRYFTLYDDAMISMRFAKHLVGGVGLTWNADGQRIEGFTNPLWVAYMGLLQWLPVAQSKISLLVQISGVVLLLINLAVVKKIAELITPQAVLVPILSLLLTASYLPLNNWALVGMEVSAVTLLTSLCTYWALQDIQGHQLSLRPYGLLMIALWVRLDTVILLMVIAAVQWWSRSENRHQIVIGSAMVVASLAVQLLARYIYYQDWLPNTYYLKMTGYPALARMTRGAYVFALFLMNSNWILFVIPWLMALWHPSRSTHLILAMILATVGYSIYIGGDAWETWPGCNRFIAAVMPLQCILIGLTLYQLMIRARQAIASTQNIWGRFRLSGLMQVAVAALVFLTILNLNQINSLEHFREKVLYARIDDYSDNRRGVKRAHWLDQITTPSATVALFRAGMTPFFLERDYIDFLGKNDKIVAHKNLPSPARWIDWLTDFYPGHMKRNYAYSIGTLQPDVVAELFYPLEAIPHLAQDYQPIEWDGLTVYLRKNSPRIHWDQVPLPAQTVGFRPN